MNSKKKEETLKETFFNLLGKSIQPLVPEGDETKESQTSDDYDVED